MRISSLGVAAAILIAAPAVAQNNATDANAVTSSTDVTANAAPAAPASPTAAPASPGNEVTPAPAVETAPPDTGSIVIQKNKVLPWGLLGLIGLIGLFGRRRSAS